MGTTSAPRRPRSRLGVRGGYELSKSRAEQRLWVRCEFGISQIGECKADFGFRESHLAQSLVHLGYRVVPLALGTFRFDVLVAEHLACGVGIMCPTEKAEVFDACRTLERERVTMFDREKAPRAAAATLLIDEG